MRSSLSISAALMLLSFQLSAASAGEKRVSMEALFSEKINPEMQIDSSQEFVHLERDYEIFFSLAALPSSELDEGGLRLSFRAANILLFYSNVFDYKVSKKYLFDLIERFNELQRRGLQSDKELRDIHDAFVTARMFDEAKRIRGAYPSVDLYVPSEIDISEGFDAKRPGLLSVSSDNDRFRLGNIKIDEGDRIIVVAECHISKDAAFAIDKDPELRAAFEKVGAIWVMPASSALDVNSVKEWNREHPRQSIGIAYMNEPWAGIDFSAMPTFYFLRNGKLISKLDGWPSSGVPKEIRDAIRSLIAR